ncbi:MAG: FG-GAP-like repeat-containing protein [bacterium]
MMRFCTTITVAVLLLGFGPGEISLEFSLITAANAALDPPVPTVPSSEVTGGNTPPQIVTGSLFFSKQVIDSFADETHSVVAADFDGDGDTDAAATDYIDGALFWYENDGADNFTTHTLDANLEGAYPSHLADVDQDGDFDILACGYLADTIVWYENNGVASFTRHEIDTVADGAHSVVVQDLDEDGDNDLLASNQDEGVIRWYENDGVENFTRHTIATGMWGAKRAEFADMDGDDDLDVVTASNYSDKIAWHENDGDENFSEHIISTTVNGAYYATPVDVDDDQDLDILTASQTDHTIGLYLNDGSGGFSFRALDTEAVGARTVIAADLDRDGDPDALSCSVDDNTVGWYENDGSGNFTQHAVDNDAAGAYGCFACDFDRDGDMDVLSASRDAYEVALHRQGRTHHATLASLGGSLLIDASLLLTTDSDDDPADLTYTVVDPPTAGELRRAGVPLSTGGTFTQADINTNLLSYEHDGSLTFADSFTFTVADGGEGGWRPAAGLFNLNIAIPILARWPLDETSGSVAEDVVGGFDGALVGDPTWLPDDGRVGGALALDGSEDSVNIGAFDITGGAGLTLALWVRPQAFIGDARLISKAAGVTEQAHYWMISTYSGQRLRFRLKAGGVTSTLITDQYVLETDVWYHVACTYDQQEMRIYGNGSLLASLPKSGAVDLAPTILAAIGNQPPGAGSYPFNGDVDDVRIYQGALSEAEITALVNPILGVFDDDQGGGDPTSRPLPLRQLLLPAVPNPFNPATTIQFDLLEAATVSLAIFDLRGRRVRTLVSEPRGAGRHLVTWDGRSDGGRRVATGVYCVRLVTPSGADQRKITLVE